VHPEELSSLVETQGVHKEVPSVTVGSLTSGHCHNDHRSCAAVPWIAVLKSHGDEGLGSGNSAGSRDRQLAAVLANQA